MPLPQTPTKNRGPIPYDNMVSAAPFTPPIEWIYIASVGSGGLVVKDEAGTTRTYTSAHLTTGMCIFGPFTEITSTTCTALLAGDGPAPRALPSSAVLGATTSGQGADTIGFYDANSHTAETTAGGVLRELLVDAKSAQAEMEIPLTSWVDADGDPLVKFADGASTIPGFNIADGEAFGIRWNNHATPDPILASIGVPNDLDDTAAIVLHVLASKTGATLADAVTFTFTAFFHTVGALHDADADAGGASSAMTGDAAAKTVQEVTRTIAAGDVPPAPAALSLTMQPTDGTLGTDDVIVERTWYEYTRKLRTS